MAEDNSVTGGITLLIGVSKSIYNDRRGPPFQVLSTKGHHIHNLKADRDPSPKHLEPQMNPFVLHNSVHKSEGGIPPPKKKAIRSVIIPRNTLYIYK